MSNGIYTIVTGSKFNRNIVNCSGGEEIPAGGWRATVNSVHCSN